MSKDSDYYKISYRNVRNLVAELFTFGAPPTSKDPLIDRQQPDGCFAGLRVFTEGKKKKHLQVPVDAAAVSGATKFSHAKMPVIALLPKKYQSPIRTCSDEIELNSEEDWPEWPRALVNGPQWRLHDEAHYRPRLGGINAKYTHKSSKTDQKRTRAWIAASEEMSILAWSTYESVSKIKCRLKKTQDWRLVAYSSKDYTHADDTDIGVLYQRASDKSCVVAFSGTNSLSELLTSAVGALPNKEFCGLESRVHSGYAKELRRIGRDGIFAGLKKYLPKCSAVSLTGHSLGGSLAELLAACINSGETETIDYELFAWKKGIPEIMPEMPEMKSTGLEPTYPACAEARTR